MPWFRLDSQAINDEKLIVLRKRHGFEGIGLYFALIMLCYENKGELEAYKLPIIFEAWETPDAQKIFDTMVEIHLFNKRGEVFFSKRVIRELEIAEDARKKYIDAGRKGGQVMAERLREKENTSVAKASPKQGLSDDQAPPKHKPTVPTNQHTLQSQPEKKGLSDDETEKQFYPLCVEFNDQAYADKTMAQLHDVRDKKRLDEIYRKMRVVINSAKHPATKPLAIKITNEIAGHVNDFGAMQQPLDASEISRRNEMHDGEDITGDTSEVF